MSDEPYYIEMESARNESEKAYFDARPQIGGSDFYSKLFRAGYERGFQKNWDSHAQLLRDKQALEAANAALVEALAMDAPWPLRDVVAKLSEAVEHLLRDHGCDNHGHENYRMAVLCGRAIIPRIEAAMSQVAARALLSQVAP